MFCSSEKINNNECDLLKFFNTGIILLLWITYICVFICVLCNISYFRKISENMKYYSCSSQILCFVCCVIHSFSSILYKIHLYNQYDKHDEKENLYIDQMIMIGIIGIGVFPITITLNYNYFGDDEEKSK
jgi:hypothetical protein